MDLPGGLFRAGEGRRYVLGPLELTFKHGGEGDTGRLSVCEGVAPLEHAKVRLHRHGYEEWHIQLEGRCLWRLADRRFEAGPGEVVHVPGGTAHGFEGMGRGVGRQLIVSAPPGVFEAFIASVSALVGAGAGGDTDALAAEHGIEFFGAVRSVIRTGAIPDIAASTAIATVPFAAAAG